MKNAEYTLDENGKIVTLTVNGKPVKAGFMRGLRKAQETPYWKLFTEPRDAQNPFTGVTRELSGLQASIYTWILLQNARYDSVPVQTFDDMRYLFLELEPDAYYDLVD